MWNFTFLFVYLFEKVIHIELERNIFHPLFHSSNATTAAAQSTESQEPGTPTWSPTSAAGTQVPKVFIIYCFLMCISRDLDQKKSSLNLNQHSAMWCWLFKWQLNPMCHNMGLKHRKFNLKSFNSPEQKIILVLLLKNNEFAISLALKTFLLSKRINGPAGMIYFCTVVLEKLCVTDCLFVQLSFSYS